MTVLVPKVDAEKCVACRKCVDFCKYNALALIKDELIIFYEICHSCGGCSLFCPQEALTEVQREVGRIETGQSGNVAVRSGFLNTGEVSGVPIIQQLLEKTPKDGLAVIDCPPGSACTVMESIRDADYCVLVAEPTLFGVHNLAMVYDLVKLFEKPFGVVLNKCMPGENPSEEFCLAHEIKILAKILYDEELGRLNSNGQLAVRESGQYRALFTALLADILEEVAT